MDEEWKNLYQAAILETDWSKLQERIEAAESAMHARLNELSLDPSSSLEESRAIADALNRVDILRGKIGAWQTSTPQG
jgi:hypothetical protein